MMWGRGRNRKERCMCALGLVERNKEWVCVWIYKMCCACLLFRLRGVGHGWVGVWKKIQKKKKVVWRGNVQKCKVRWMCGGGEYVWWMERCNWAGILFGWSTRWNMKEKKNQKMTTKGKQVIIYISSATRWWPLRVVAMGVGLRIFGPSDASIP